MSADQLPLIELPSPTYEARPEGMPIDILILHCTGMPTGGMAIKRLTDPVVRVSSHYVVEEDGTTYRLVPEEMRAFHAGESFWGGQTNLNDRAIGIEIVNRGAQFCGREFPEAQMNAVLELSLGILARHPIPPERVLGHSDIAAIRRWYCPGDYFPWEWLAQNGVGIWPKQPAARRSNDPAETLLARYGYQTAEDEAVTCSSVAAFQRHFRPTKVNGILDEECHAILDTLCDQVGALKSVAGSPEMRTEHVASP